MGAPQNVGDTREFGAIRSCVQVFWFSAWFAGRARSLLSDEGERRRSLLRSARFLIYQLADREGAEIRNEIVSCFLGSSGFSKSSTTTMMGGAVWDPTTWRLCNAGNLTQSFTHVGYIVLGVIRRQGRLKDK